MKQEIKVTQSDQRGKVVIIRRETGVYSKDCFCKHQKKGLGRP